MLAIKAVEGERTILEIVKELGKAYKKIGESP